MTRLWNAGTSSRSAGVAVQMRVKDVVADVNKQVISRGVRAVNVLRNAELEVLKGQRSGERRRKPYTRHAMYTASAPGEPPARRTGNLRLHWNGNVKNVRSTSNGGVSMCVSLESQEHYSIYLEEGTEKMEPRPFKNRIVERATPEINRIFGEPYS